MRELPPRDVLAGVRRGASYARGVWERLNGGGGGGREGGRLRLPDFLPLPSATKVGPPRLCAAVAGCIRRPPLGPLRYHRLEKATIT